ncbi:MAG: hypothetical protein HY665_00880 [Chloroflexi bacterium]|nr:hypothetical protein [Chloroflexota bacterium]
MVKELRRDGKTYYICEQCGFVYETQELARRCQEFCEKNQACNLEISQYAVSLTEVSST